MLALGHAHEAADDILANREPFGAKHLFHGQYRRTRPEIDNRASPVKNSRLELQG